MYYSYGAVSRASVCCVIAFAASLMPQCRGRPLVALALACYIPMYTSTTTVLACCWCPLFTHGGPTPSFLVPLRSLCHMHAPQGHTYYVTCVAFSPDGRLASGSEDRTVRIWQNVASS